jgi:hypothetical protein
MNPPMDYSAGTSPREPIFRGSDPPQQHTPQGIRLSDTFRSFYSSYYEGCSD